GLEGTITIRPGDRIPLIPSHLFKLFADYRATSRLSVALDLIASSGMYARGNENNLSQPDGTYYLGAGSTSAYGVVNVGARYQIAKPLQLIAQVNNLFDSHYNTAPQPRPTRRTAA